MFDIQVQLTKEIYGKVFAGIFLRRFLKLYVIMGLIVIALIVATVTGPPQTVEWKDYLLPCLFILSFIALPILQRLFGYGWKSAHTARQLARYHISPDGLTVDGESYHGFQAWENFMGIRQLGEAVVLFFTRNQIFIFPNESFLSFQQRDEFISFIEQRIPKGKRRLLKSPMAKRVAMLVAIWIGIIVAVFIFLTMSRE